MLKKNYNVFVIVLPIIILLFGVVAFFFIYNMYGKTVSPFDCLFSVLENVKKFFCDPYAVLSNGYRNFAIRIFWYVWWGGFITSVYFMGRQFQKKPELNAESAILIMKEPYFLLKDICNVLKQITNKHEVEELNALFVAVIRLEERLSVESDFGYGNKKVISCENDIAKQLQLLRDSILNIETGDIMGNIYILYKVILNVNSLLTKRTELKKRGF